MTSNNHPVDETVIQTKGLEFKTLTQGDGDRVALCLHGFPGDANGMRPIMRILSKHGFTAISPFLRGHGETEKPPDGDYSSIALAEDIYDILDAVEASDPLIVGHGWGAIAATQASQFKRSEEISACIVMGAPPNYPEDITSRQVFRGWYITLLQIPGFGEEMLRANDFALVERLWQQFDPDWNYTQEQLEELKTTYRQSRTVDTIISMYQQLFDGFATAADDDFIVRGIEVPTLVMTGEHDGVFGKAIYEKSSKCYAGPHQLEIIDNAGHFVHHVKPETVEDRITEFIGDH